MGWKAAVLKREKAGGEEGKGLGSGFERRGGGLGKRFGEMMAMDEAIEAALHSLRRGRRREIGLRATVERRGLGGKRGL